MSVQQSNFTSHYMCYVVIIYTYAIMLCKHLWPCPIEQCHSSHCSRIRKQSTASPCKDDKMSMCRDSPALCRNIACIMHMSRCDAFLHDSSSVAKRHARTRTQMNTWLANKSAPTHEVQQLLCMLKDMYSYMHNVCINTHHNNTTVQDK